MEKDIKTIEENKTRYSLHRTFSAGSSTRYPLLSEGEVSVCRISHGKTLAQKIVYFLPLRRWENHRLVLSDNHLYSTTPKGYMTFGLAYNEIQEVVRGMRNASKSRAPYILHLVIPRSGSLLIQMNNSYNRDSWFYSLVWKITACRFKKLFSKIKKPEELTGELEELVNFSLTNPISDAVIYQLPMNSISGLLLHHGHEINDHLRTEIIKTLSPILEMSPLTPAICKCFQRITRHHPLVEIGDSFLGSVHRVLKHNTEFGKLPHLRMFVQDYLCFVHWHDTKNGVLEFIQGLHTANTNCPHPRALPNLISVSLAAIFSVYEDAEINEDEKNRILRCFQAVYEAISSFADWLPTVAALLQAVPFPNEALVDKNFNGVFRNIVLNFAKDYRCEVHQCVFPIRGDKKGWVHHFAVGGPCDDDGVTFAEIVSHLVPCCGKRKKVLIQLKDNLRHLFVLMAIRGSKDCIEVLIGLLDFDLIENEDENLEIIAALQSSEEGRRQYEVLCAKREEFAVMKQSGGPHKLTLPSQSTDEDLIHVLKSGSFGNLQSLNLAFTKVTSESAKYIIQLPSLLHLNLWATAFDDEGVQLIAEHLHRLQSLNLCETSVTDDGLNALVFLENLRILNLNSTKLSAITFELLKEKLTDLQVVDVRYTEAF